MTKKRQEIPQTFEEVLEQEGAVVTTLGDILANVDEGTDEKTQFINDNISLVPNNRRNVFLTWDIDRQFKEMKRWKEIKEWKDKMREMNKIENKVKELFIKRKVTVEEVEDVIKFCNGWIDEAREHEIVLIDEEIAKLEERRNNLKAR